jgi:hypothetical protein
MNHLLVDVYQVCSNKSLGVKIGPAPGGHCFSLYDVYSKNLKKSSFKKPLELELRYLA